MQRHRDALIHLNAALDAMVETGDTLMIAAIAYPIAIAERHILNRQAAIIRQRFGCAGPAAAPAHPGAAAATVPTAPSRRHPS